MKKILIGLLFVINVMGCSYKVVTSPSELESYVKVQEPQKTNISVITILPNGNPMPVKKLVLSDDGKFLYISFHQHKKTTPCGGLRTLMHFTGVSSFFLNVSPVIMGTVHVLSTKGGFIIYDLDAKRPSFCEILGYSPFVNILNNNTIVFDYGIEKISGNSMEYKVDFDDIVKKYGCTFSSLAREVLKTSLDRKIIALYCQHKTGSFFTEKYYDWFLFLDSEDMSLVSKIEVPVNGRSLDIIPIPNSQEVIMPVLYNNQYAEIFLVNYITGESQRILSGFSQWRLIPIDINPNANGRYIAIISLLVPDRKAFLHIFDLDSGIEVFRKELAMNYIPKIKSWGFYKDKLIIADEEKIYSIDINTHKETTILNFKNINLEREDIGDACLTKILVDTPRKKIYIPVGANVLVANLDFLSL